MDDLYLSQCMEQSAQAGMVNVIDINHTLWLWYIWFLTITEFMYGSICDDEWKELIKNMILYFHVAEGKLN